MKNRILLCFCLLLTIAKVNAQNAELTTLRIGAFKYGMTLKEVKAITEKPLRKGKGQYGTDCDVAIYKGQEIQLDGITLYEGGNENDQKVVGLATKSTLFKTKSGLGVGSTKEQLFKAYKDYPNFSVGQRWDDKAHKLSTTETFFSLEDIAAGTNLMFIMVNNIVTEVSIYIDEEG